jgi:hypothetical protein
MRSPAAGQAPRRGFGAGGWCTWFHPRTETSSSAEGGRACKERPVREGKAHAALVSDGDLAVAWCQFGAVAGQARRQLAEIDQIVPPRAAR